MSETKETAPRDTPDGTDLVSLNNRLISIDSLKDVIVKGIKRADLILPLVEEIHQVICTDPKKRTISPLFIQQLERVIGGLHRDDAGWIAPASSIVMIIANISIGATDAEIDTTIAAITAEYEAKTNDPEPDDDVSKVKVGNFSASKSIDYWNAGYYLPVDLKDSKPYIDTPLYIKMGKLDSIKNPLVRELIHDDLRPISVPNFYSDLARIGIVPHTMEDSKRVIKPRFDAASTGKVKSPFKTSFEQTRLHTNRSTTIKGWITLMENNPSTKQIAAELSPYLHNTGYRDSDIMSVSQMAAIIRVLGETKVDGVYASTERMSHDRRMAYFFKVYDVFLQADVIVVDVEERNFPVRTELIKRVNSLDDAATILNWLSKLLLSKHIINVEIHSTSIPAEKYPALKKTIKDYLTTVNCTLEKLSASSSTARKNAVRATNLMPMFKMLLEGCEARDCQDAESSLAGFGDIYQSRRKSHDFYQLDIDIELPSEAEK